MANRIALFNHKGGVSKTTTSFHLGWMLAAKGHRVLLADADPQCNLTGLVLGLRGYAEFEKFYKAEKNNNIYAGLQPAFESQPKLISPLPCVSVNGQKDLFLLPGHIGLSEYEVTLGIAQELSGSLPALKNIPGCFDYLLAKTTEKLKMDYVLIDLNPSLSSINQNLLMTSDFFVVPTNPDYFSLMALHSLANVLPKWAEWARKAATLPILREASYPFPSKHPKFLGSIIQKFRPRAGVPARAFQEWIDELLAATKTTLVPSLGKSEMLLPMKIYVGAKMQDSLCLSQIADFNSLIAMSQEHNTPVFALTDAQIKQSGVVLDQTKKQKQAFLQAFSDLADKIHKLVANAASP